MTEPVMRAMQPLDTLQCPLEGVSLVEASAGTGKTWSICNLYVRLLIEQRRDVREILVVTFSEKAAAELRDRIRQRLVQMKSHWSGTASNDGYTAQLAQALIDHDPEAAAQGPLRVERALSAFDEAPIWTIHGFFRRALGEVPFAAYLPMAIELSADDDGEALAVVRDDWRSTVQAGLLPPALVDWIAAHGETPERLAELLERRMARPLSRLVWPVELDGLSLQQVFERLQQAMRMRDDVLDEARKIWRSRRDGIVEALTAAGAVLSQTTHKPAIVSQAAQAWDRIVAGLALDDRARELAHKLTLSSLRKATKKGRQAPSDPFFGCAEAWAEKQHQLDLAVILAVTAWRRDLLERLPAQVHARKREKRVASFDDLLTSLHRCLFDPDLPWLASRLRERFPVALIDEFQDTDPLQLAIFGRIYREGADGHARQHPDPVQPHEPASSFTLFMVGDPKQAIYGFRNADLHAYLSARERASHQWSMTVNHRATPAMVAALNHLFTRNRRVFQLDGLDYATVQASERPRPRFVDPGDAGAVEDVALRIGLLPVDAIDGATPRLNLNQARHLSIATTVNEIVRLLEAGRTGHAGFEPTGGESPAATAAPALRPLSGGDIAVLVRTNREAELVRDALTAAGVGSVLASQRSVYETEDATQLAQVLAACLDPGNEATTRVALATEWIGMNAAQIRAWALSEDQVQQWRERFETWHDVWARRGVASAMMRMMVTCHTVQRLLPRIDGERRLTNFRHLVEGLQCQATHLRAPRSQWKWLRAQCRGEGRTSDGTQLRLESDRDLVQILTIHKSKGLEFPIVFLPLSWRESDPLSRRSALVPAEYHDDRGDRVMDFVHAMNAELGRSDACGDIDRLRRTEAQAESTRLLYVALTRAVHRCYVVAGEWAATRGPSADASSLNRLLDDGAGDAALTVTDRWRALRGPSIRVCPLREEPARRLEHRASPGGMPHAAPVPSRVAPGWRIDSYSGLIRRAGAVRDGLPGDQPSSAAVAGQSDLAARDHENHVVGQQADDPSDDSPASEAQASAGLRGEPDDDDMLGFPRGPAAGDCVHAVLEYADFTRPAQWPEAIAKALRHHPGFGPLAPGRLLSLLRHVTATPLRDGLLLRNVPNRKRLNEWEFHLPAKSLDAPRLQARLEAHGYPCPPLDFAHLEGYLKGFVDLLFEHGGRYWILDWKSNHLGHHPRDYGQDAMQAEMIRHEYHLQALLYTVAVERFLRQRIRRFDWDRHFGGVLYLFVRGVRPEWTQPGAGPAGADGDVRTRPAGVWFDRPSLDLVKAIGGTLDGR